MITQRTCNECGAEMAYFQEGMTCGWICERCGNAITTSYIEPIELDEREYTVAILRQEPDAGRIKSVSKALGCNYVEARKALLEGTLTFSGLASEVRSKAVALQNGNVLFGIEPDFPYVITPGEDAD